MSEYNNLFTPPSPTSQRLHFRLLKYDLPIYPRRGQSLASAMAAVHRQAATEMIDCLEGFI